MRLIPTGTGVLFRQELRTLGRWRFYYGLRYGVLLFTALSLAAVLCPSPIGNPYRYESNRLSMDLAEFGRDLVGGISIGLFVLLLVVMPVAMGGVLAAGREKGRLDLLRMTPIDPTQIVLEKLLSRVAYALHWVVLGAPFYLLPIVFGGVTPVQVLVAVLFPMAAAVWVSAAALLVTTSGRGPIGTVSMTYLVCAVFLFPGIALLEQFRFEFEWFFHVFPLAALAYLPLEDMWGVGGAGGGSGVVHVDSLMWQIPLEVAAFTAFAILLASWRLRREERGLEASAAREAVGGGRRRVWDHAVAWKEVQMATGTGIRRVMTLVLALYVSVVLMYVARLVLDLGRVRFHGGQFGLVPNLACAQAGILVAWVGGITGLCGTAAAAFPRRARVLGAVLAGAVILAAVSLLIVLSGGGASLPPSRHLRLMISLTEVLAGGSLFLGALLGAGAVLAAPVSIAAERSRGTLDSLHLTPLRAGAILDGKAAGCFWALFPGLTLLAVHLGLLCLLSGFRVAGVLVFLLTVSAWLLLLVQAGLWISTRSRGPIRALLAMILALHVFAAANGLLIMLFGFFGPLGLYVNPVYWVVLALGWGGARDLVQVWALAPLWGYALMFFACGLWAWDLRRRAIGVFEARRVT